MEIDFTLHRATAADSPAIKALIHRVRINPMGLDWQRFLLAVDASGTMLGCGQLKPHGEATWELASIAVDPGYRGQGIARAIIEALLVEAPRPLYLTCRSRLGSFYQQWGFQALNEAEMPTYFRRLSRLASLFNGLSRYDDVLLVMVLK